MAVGMKIAVTGGSGRIGGAVIVHLLERGHHPVNLDIRQAYEPRVPFVYCDAGRREMLQPALGGMDAVVHLGEIPTANVGLAPNEVYARNTAAGSCVFQTAADLRIGRVVYASSAQVYGVTGEPPIAPRCLPIDESHPAQPTNVYSISKMANEAYARCVAETYGMSITAFRLPKVIFPWHKRYIAENLRRREPLLELGLYVGKDDVARAIELALQHPPGGFEVYNLSAADVLCQTPIRDRLAADYPSYPPLPTDWPATGSPLLTHKIRKHLGWEPTFSAMQSGYAEPAEEAA